MPHDEEQYAALEAALVRIDESAGVMFHVIGVGVDEHFARWLVRSGRVDAGLFRRLWEAYSNDGDTGDDERDGEPPGPRLVEAPDGDAVRAIVRGVAESEIRHMLDPCLNEIMPSDLNLRLVQGSIFEKAKPMAGSIADAVAERLAGGGGDGTKT